VPNKAQAAKYLRASHRRRIRNKPVRSHARTTVRDALTAMNDASAQGEWGDADAALATAIQALDKAASQGVIHANSAARRKSRLLRQFSHLKNPDPTRRSRTRPPEPAKESATA
jgi:small subunit ribosomal protein S20